MNRKLISILLLLITTMCSSQIIEGKYCWDEGLMYQCYTFNSNNTFTFYHPMHVATEEGVGTYKISGDSLLLRYDTIDFYVNQFKIDTIEELHDSLKITINVFDYDSKKEIKDYQTTLSTIYEPEVYHQLSDMEQIVIPKPPSEHFCFNVEKDGYAPIAFSTPQSGNFNVRIFLKEGRGVEYFMKSGVENYLILYRDKDIISILANGFTFDLTRERN